MENQEEKIEDRFLKLVDSLHDFFQAEEYVRKLNIKRLQNMKSVAEKEYKMKSSVQNDQENSTTDFETGYAFLRYKFYEEQIEYEIESQKEMKKLNLELSKLNFTYLSDNESESI